MVLAEICQPIFNELIHIFWVFPGGNPLGTLGKTVRWAIVNTKHININQSSDTSRKNAGLGIDLNSFIFELHVYVRGYLEPSVSAFSQASSEVQIPPLLNFTHRQIQ